MSAAAHLAQFVFVSLIGLVLALILAASDVLSSPWPMAIAWSIGSGLVTAYHIWRDR